MWASENENLKIYHFSYKISKFLMNFQYTYLFHIYLLKTDTYWYVRQKPKIKTKLIKTIKNISKNVGLKILNRNAKNNYQLND